LRCKDLTAFAATLAEIASSERTPDPGALTVSSLRAAILRPWRGGMLSSARDSAVARPARVATKWTGWSRAPVTVRGSGHVNFGDSEGDRDARW